MPRIGQGEEQRIRSRVRWCGTVCQTVVELCQEMTSIFILRCEALALHKDSLSHKTSGLYFVEDERRETGTADL